MADEPFCPDEKYSSTSLISVLCRLRISTASRSIEEAIIDRHENHEACLSRGITCVEIISGFNPIFEATYVSTEGPIFANVPTAPEIAQTEISSLALDSLS